MTFAVLTNNSDSNISIYEDGGKYTEIVSTTYIDYNGACDIDEDPADYIKHTKGVRLG